MTEQQIETLAQEHTQGLAGLDKLDGTYLRALVTGTQSKLGPKKGKRPNEDAQLSTLEQIAVPFYAAVLRGVTTDDIALDATLEHAEVVVRNRERNRRAVFARTAKSTLVAWVRAGGDLRAIDVSTVTKSELRASTAAAYEGEPGARLTAVQKAQARILAAVACDPPEVARERLHAVIMALQEAIDELPPVEPEVIDYGESTVIRKPGGTFRGHTQPAQLHRSASP
jgi:hypothetical protein